MNNNTGVETVSQNPEKHLKKVRDIYIELFKKLFIGRETAKQRRIYNRIIEKTARKKFKMRSENFVHAAINELRDNFKAVKLSPKGRILNAKQIGPHFQTLWQIAAKNVDLFVIHENAQLQNFALPFSESYKQRFAKIIGLGEIVVVLIVKHPPEETALEIRKVTDKCLHGLMSLWADKRFQQTKDIRDGLKDYLHHATVRVLTTAHNPETDKISGELNQHLEKHGGFEDAHWIRVAKGVSRDEKKESLKQALIVCIPIIAAIKLVERFVPGALHALGGVLDDLFGAIIPDVSQSMGAKENPFEERLKSALPVFKGGLISLPAALLMGWGSAVLYKSSPAVGVHILAGILFAFACCAGTLGTSVAAIKKAYSAINELQKDEKYGYLVSDLDTMEKFKLAFKEAIMDVPFRVGHTLIGVPFQLLLGIAAGAFGFFHNSIFIMVEGMAETLLGAATTYFYPWFARSLRNFRLRLTSFDS
jgi:hypothetical protein